MITAGIVGGTGYTGVELLRLLAAHPDVSLRVITSRGAAGTRVGELFPSLRRALDLTFSAPDPAFLAECDVVFFATPHATAMSLAPALLEAGSRLVDLSADFRLRDPAQWAQWYGQQHAAPTLLAEAVYGLPERNRAAIRQARLVACPGCYPTAIQLGLLPLLDADWVDRDSLIASAASGVSGAGRVPKLGALLTEAGESLSAYAVGGHRHLPEIEQQLAAFAGGSATVTFVPHLAPMTRGIHATLYARLREPVSEAQLQSCFDAVYADEPFVDVLPLGSVPATRDVRGSNVCRLAVHRPQGRETVVILSAIDNLVKGAAGQAVQNMNLMFGLPETQGLAVTGLVP
ncbi:MAG TPA: N-acetyl-gamma-glutamyl-phosphate reductase [Gammaproteobacteria bacterium]|nr:N-acetyl-gamma-glutamyl-phosphate reductase [Gammaproteobacteria bacterium]